MNLYWWGIFSLNLLLSAGIMLTYLSRRDSKSDTLSPKESDSTDKRVLVIIPAKGVDYEMDKNLASIRDQDFEKFDIISVVDSEEDQAVSFLKREGIKFIISTGDCAKCSGKVKAIYSALVTFLDYDYYVIADSDIRAQPDWLSGLIEPLIDTTIGVSTTFPVFFPEGGFWTKVKMFWGLVGQSMMESNLTKFVWGGSMAFRGTLLDKESLNFFSESVSDDIAILKISKEKGLKISYVPESRPRIYSNDDFPTFLEWSSRQTAFSIYSTNNTFRFGIIYYTVAAYLVLSSLVFAVLVNDIFLLFLLPYIVNSVNSQMKVPVKVWYFLSVTFILPYIYIWNLIVGMVRKKVHWRGSVYSLSKD